MGKLLHWGSLKVLGVTLILAIANQTFPVWAQSAELSEAFYRQNGLREQGRYAEAIPFAVKALELGQKEFGPKHKLTASLLNNLAILYEGQGRYAEAESFYKRALEIFEQVLGPDHSDVGKILGNLAYLHNRQGRYDEAEPLAKRALAIQEKTLGPGDLSVAEALNGLAAVYKEQGRYTAAAPTLERALAIQEKTLGLQHPKVASTLNSLAMLYQNQGRYDEAEPLYKRSLATRELFLGPNHPSVAYTLNNLASWYGLQGRYAEAEAHLKRALEIFEQVLGPDHSDAAISLNYLGNIYQKQGRYTEAELLLKRAQVITEKALGPNHHFLSRQLDNLATVYSDQGRYDEAEPLYRRALVILEKALGPNHANVGATLNALAGLYIIQGRYDEAEPLFRRAQAIYEKAQGLNHPSVGTALSDLAGLYIIQGRYDEAEPLLKRAQAISENALGPNHPSVNQVLYNLAALYALEGRYAEALTLIRRGSISLRTRFTGTGIKETVGLLSEQKKVRKGLYLHISLALYPENWGDRSALEAEAFEVVQLARTSAAAGAVARMAARFASADDAVASLVRKLQDATIRYASLDQNFIQFVGTLSKKRNFETETGIRSELNALKGQIIDLERQITEQFPRYAELTSRSPLSLGHTQQLLGPNEALITFIGDWGGDNTHVFVVRHDQATTYTVELGAEAFGRMVAELRAGVKLQNVERLSELPIFNTTEAYELYQKLLAPSEPYLKRVKHLFVVPSGALQSIPLGVLVTERPEQAPLDFSDYQDVAWLAEKFAITTLPSVASLRALRAFAARTKSTKPFIGFGDPILRGTPGSTKGIEIASLFRGAIADVEEVRNLARLPNTADELRAIASYLGADDEVIYLQDRATETMVKSLPLKDNRVVAFSTHGLVSGEIKHLAEPALVLTPPAKGDEHDDGLLTASEIAKLKLDAEWVILSACNTASGGKPGAEGLSGLAKAFFYAGARTLLVSHWPVETNAATALIQGIFEELETNPEIGRSEALRRSMLALAANDNYAHPALWAPFVVVGEGARP